MSYPWLAQTAQNKAAVREGLKIVRKVIARDAAKTPLSTAALYRLAVREAPPPSYALSIPSPEDEGAQKELGYGRSGRKRVPGPTAPHPRHPVRSISFLKHNILPIIVGERAVQHVRETRLVAAQSKGSRTATSTATQTRGAKGANPAQVETMVWLWQAMTPPSRAAAAAKAKANPAPPPAKADNYDFSHMKQAKRKAHRLRIELAAKYAGLAARRNALKTEARRKVEKEREVVRKAEGRVRHEREEREALARKAERRARWEKANPVAAKALKVARQREEEERRKRMA
ncbi:hypothetical protein B0H14DRAFT_3432059 [Mycena olivaceomarginata]|nr:hypothetical protein B0H14DRAFT_3432059 [Mycena olivaceomarginata]